MKFSKWIKKLKKNKAISRWPPTWVPFVLTAIILVEAYLFPFEKLSCALYWLAGFAFLFAVAHWYVVRTLDRGLKSIV